MRILMNKAYREFLKVYKKMNKQKKEAKQKDNLAEHKVIELVCKAQKT